MRERSSLSEVISWRILARKDPLDALERGLAGGVRWAAVRPLSSVKFIANAFLIGMMLPIVIFQKVLYMFELANPGARSDLKCRPWRHTAVLRSQSFRGAMGPN